MKIMKPMTSPQSEQQMWVYVQMVFYRQMFPCSVHATSPAGAVWPQLTDYQAWAMSIKCTHTSFVSLKTWKEETELCFHKTL